jgi:PAS domain S-box-containing protein
MPEGKDYYRREYETLLEQIPNAVFMIDPVQDRLIEVNTAACRLLGYECAELVDRIRPRDIHPHEIDAFIDFTRDVEEKGETRTDKLSCMTADGRVVPVHISAALTHGPDGRVLIRVVVTDAGREKALEQALEDSSGFTTTRTTWWGRAPLGVRCFRRSKWWLKRMRLYSFAERRVLERN